MSNGDIEDVLSSIRRLVAEEGKTPLAPPPAPSDGKLILTPALRVVAADEARAPEAGADVAAVTAAVMPEAGEVALAADEAAPDGAALVGAAQDAVVQDVAGVAPDLVASIGAATDRDAVSWESETGDAWSAENEATAIAALVRSGPSGDGAAEDARSADAPGRPFASEVTDGAEASASGTGPAGADAWTDIDIWADATPAWPDAADVPVTAAPDLSGGADDPQMAEVLPVVPAGAAEMGVRDVPAAVTDSLAADAPLGVEVPPEPAAAVERSGGDATLVVPVLSQPSAVAGASAGDETADIAGQSGPFGLGEGVAAEAAADMGVEAGAPPSVDASTTVAQAPDAPVGGFAHRPGPVGGVVPPYAGLEDDEGPLDEEALRDLVRETIREELQGPLGERITRNLRKLVRAEVQRALAAKSLE